MTMTHSGYTAYKISSMRPKANVYAPSPSNRRIPNQPLIWCGACAPSTTTRLVSTDHTIADIKHILRSGRFVQEGDLVVNVQACPSPSRAWRTC
ncbi:MAG: hypothetical protein IPF41_04405 [Flavobacteriales bacterium]|nr:hypothetical protein [Flavobacteriales bacterium]